MAKLVSLRDDHRRNFERSRELGEVLQRASQVSCDLPRHGAALLYCYAAESGLKMLLHRDGGIPFEHESDTDKSGHADGSTPKSVERFGHDLALMLKQLKIERDEVPVPVGPFKTIGGHNDGQTFELKNAHEAWRYGLPIDSADQRSLEVFLELVIDHIAETT